MIQMGLSKKITGYDRFMDKFNAKKRQLDNSQKKKNPTKQSAAKTDKGSQP